MKGVKFGNKHSFSDWGLIMKSRPEISPPEPKTIYIDVPATDGHIDLTEALAGDVAFNNRNIECTFTVIDERKKWSDIYSDILDYLHGQRIKAVMDDDPAYYYLGRFKVDEWKSDKRTSTITISGNVEPYKYRLISTVDEWEWDTFNFETDIITNYSSVPFDASSNWYALDFYCERKKIIPSITFSWEDTSIETITGVLMGRGEANMPFTFQNGVVTKNPSLKFKQGWNTIRVMQSTVGTVRVDYRNGRL